MGNGDKRRLGKGAFREKKKEKKRFPSGSCPLSHTVLGYCLIIFGLQSRFPKTSGCAEGAGSLHPRWPSPPGPRISSPLAPAPPSIRGPNRFPRIFASRKIYLFIYNIYICVCLITTHPHAYTYFYSHSLTRAPTAAGLRAHLASHARERMGKTTHPLRLCFCFSLSHPQKQGAAPSL